MPPKKPRDALLKCPRVLVQTQAQLKKQRAALDREIRKLDVVKKALKKPAAAGKGKGKKKKTAAPKKGKTKVPSKPKTKVPSKTKSKSKPLPPRRAKLLPSERPERIAMPLPDNWTKK